MPFFLFFLSWWVLDKVYQPPLLCTRYYLSCVLEKLSRYLNYTVERLNANMYSENKVSGEKLVCTSTFWIPIDPHLLYKGFLRPPGHYIWKYFQLATNGVLFWPPVRLVVISEIWWMHPCCIFSVYFFLP